MRPRDRNTAKRLDAALQSYSSGTRRLPGITDPKNRESLVEQLLESIHRVRYVAVVSGRELSALRADPNSLLFDPMKAAILSQRSGDTEEAFWLVFLFVHFGRHRLAHWRYAREVYGQGGNGSRWDWKSVSTNPAAFRAWLKANQAYLKRGGQPHGFGNHRKYESLDAISPTGTGAVVESYVNWVDPPRTHQQLFAKAAESCGREPCKTFGLLYDSMKAVERFGRTARFDYLTMVGKLGLARIEPPSAYLGQATGPKAGAKLLFGANVSSAILDQWLIELDADLNVGMQVLEDALCNWQKSPSQFKPFRG